MAGSGFIFCGLVEPEGGPSGGKSQVRMTIKSKKPTTFPHIPLAGGLKA